MSIKYFLCLFDTFSYSIGFATLIFGFIVYLRVRDKISRYHLYFFAGSFIMSLAYIGDTLSAAFKIPAYISQRHLYQFMYELVFSLGSLLVVYYGPTFIYKASGAKLPKRTGISLLCAGVLFLITDIVNVTYEKAINPNFLMEFSRYFVYWFYIAFALALLAMAFSRYPRIKYPEIQQLLKSILFLAVLGIPAEFFGNNYSDILERYQIPRYFFSSSLLYLFWSLVNFRAFIGQLLRQNQPVSPGQYDRSSETIPISEREQEIIGLVSQGLSNQEIAAKLHISLATVKSHLHRIFVKTGVTSRMALLHILNSTEYKVMDKQVQ